MPGLLAAAGPMLPQVAAGLMADPNDFTAAFNTELSPEDEASFQKWLSELSKTQGRDAGRDLYDYDLRGAFKVGASRAANGHLPDTFKKPNHPTFSVESQYNGAGGYQGGQWTQDKSGKWTFKATSSQLKFHPADELQKYFKTREPGVTLVLPEASH